MKIFTVKNVDMWPKLHSEKVITFITLMVQQEGIKIR